MEIVIEYIKQLERLFLKMVIQSEKKDIKIEEQLSKLLIIFAENGAKPEEIEKCLNSKEIIDESYKDLSSDSDKVIDDDYSNKQNDLLNYFSHPNLKEETIDFIRGQNKKMTDFGFNLSDNIIENIIKEEYEENKNFLGKKRESDNKDIKKN
jgi:hypothetical protein